MEYKSIKGNIVSIGKKIVKKSLDYDQILTKYEKSTFIGILENMLKNRFLDEEINLLIKEGIAITKHSTFGQEGSQTVAFSLLEKEDYGVPNHINSLVLLLYYFSVKKNILSFLTTKLLD